MWHTVRIKAFFCNLAHDGVFAPINRFILVVHNGSGTQCCVLTEISSKPWDGRNDDDHPEFAVLLAGANTSIDNRPANEVVNRRLFLSGGSN